MRAAAATLAALAPATLAPPAAAQDDLRLLPAPVLAPRGGVLVLPLDPERPRGGWPRTVAVELADGRTVEGRIAVALPRRDARIDWSVPAVPRRVVPAASLGPDEAFLGVPRLLAALPQDGAGPITVAGRTLPATWADATASYTRFDLPGDEAPRMEPAFRRDRPDPDDPFEHWRWVLVADRLGLRPPDPARFGPAAGGSVEAELLARAEADRWRIGLARIAAASPGIAAACRDVLVRTVDDAGASALAGRAAGPEGLALAAWEAAPAELATLLQTALDPGRTDLNAAEAALAWADARPAWIAWPLPPGLDDGRTLALAIMRPGREDLAVSFRWDRPRDVPDAASGTAVRPPVNAPDAAVVASITAGRVQRFRLERPDVTRAGPEPLQSEPFAVVPPGGAGGPGSASVTTAPGPVLRVHLGDDEIALGTQARWTAAGPPRTVLPAFRPVLRLVEVTTGVQAPVPAELATSAHVRRRDGRWELFVECRRPLAAYADGADELELRLGTGSTPKIRLRIPERGPVVQEIGPPAVGGGSGPPVFRRSWGDRWYCRVVLPDRWYVEARLGIGVIRRTRTGPEAAPFVQSSPAPRSPGEDDPGRFLIDLATW